METPEVRYARSGALRIAYQVFGDGPPVLVVPPIVSNVELAWEHELWRRTLEAFAERARTIMFDKRGLGLSDRYEALPSLRERVDDMDAVLDAAGVERCSLIGASEGGLMAQYYAVLRPERVDRMCLTNAFADPILPAAMLAPYADGPLPTIEDLLPRVVEVVESWGDDPEPFVRWFMPSQLANASFVRWVGRLERLTGTQADCARQFESLSALEAVDSTAVRVPTLVVHARGDRMVPVAWGRWLAAHIPQADYWEIEGEDHFIWAMPDWRAYADRVLDFVTGPSSRRATSDRRRFATVLFTDIVGSTDSARRLGDRAWQRTLDSHDRTTWQVTDRFGGRVVKSTGDGVLAIFDTPSSATACATALIRELGNLNIDIRAGLHAGEIVERSDGDIAGLAVNIASRVEQIAGARQVLVSSTIRDLLLGSDVVLTNHGEYQLKGLEGSWRLFAAQ